MTPAEAIIVTSASSAPPAATAESPAQNVYCLLLVSTKYPFDIGGEAVSRGEQGVRVDMVILRHPCKQRYRWHDGAIFDLRKIGIVNAERWRGGFQTRPSVLSHLPQQNTQVSPNRRSFIAHRSYLALLAVFSILKVDMVVNPVGLASLSTPLPTMLLSAARGGT